MVYSKTLARKQIQTQAKTRTFFGCWFSKKKKEQFLRLCAVLLLPPFLWLLLKQVQVRINSCWTVINHPFILDSEYQGTRTWHQGQNNSCISKVGNVFKTPERFPSKPSTRSFSTALYTTFWSLKVSGGCATGSFSDPKGSRHSQKSVY